ncbi:sulfatase domain-containing protein [Phthorimaea operculella]|nr:sulfatase domain-containing protein [Phthorimaea operculella]
MWTVRALLAFVVTLAAAQHVASSETERPHIILIVADDLGWNDVGFHGMNHIPTPNIDALAASASPCSSTASPHLHPLRAALLTARYPIHAAACRVTLQQHCVTPSAPSRAALLTARYPIHTGMQHGVLYGMEPRGLPLGETLLPQHLRRLGYRTHLVGKWHLGSHSKHYLPLHRGFESHLGFWTGKIDMYDHTNAEQGSWGTDFRRNFTTAHDLFGKYATDIYTEEAVRVIRSHDARSPLFLMVAHSAVHSGNPWEPIRAPDQLVDSYSHIADPSRRRFAAELSKLDESVGAVVSALQAAGLLRRSIILFTSDNGGPAAGFNDNAASNYPLRGDNGGPAAGFNDNAASNYPLRGVKNTLWEGGVRGAALLWSPLLDKRSRVSTQLVHLVDWLPTLYTAAGGNASDLGNNLDGFSLWESLSKDLPSPRAAAPTLINIDDVWGNAGLLVGEWKLLIGTNYNGKWDEWYGPAGREVPYDADRVMNSSAARAITQLGLMPSRDTLLRLRSEATVSCDPGPVAVPCFPLKAPCLFNLAQDPCERRNLADTHPDKLQELLSVLNAFNRTAVPASRSVLDPAGDPRAGDESTPTSATTAARAVCLVRPRAGDESTPTSATTARRPRCVPSATPRAGDESTPTSATTARRPRCVPSATRALGTTLHQLPRLPPAARALCLVRPRALGTSLHQLPRLPPAARAVCLVRPRALGTSLHQLPRLPPAARAVCLVRPRALGTSLHQLPRLPPAARAVCPVRPRALGRVYTNFRDYCPPPALCV